MNRKNIFFLIRLAVSIGAISLILTAFRGRFHEVFQLLGGIDRWVLVVGFLLVLLSQLLVTARLNDILRAQSVVISYRELFYLSMIGLFFNNFLPSALGGDVVKAYYAGRQSQKRMEPYTAVFTDRAVGYVTLISWSVIGLWVYRHELRNPAIYHSVTVMVLVAIGLILFFVNRGVARPYHWVVRRMSSEMWRVRLERMYDCINGYRKHPYLMLFAVFLSALSHFSLIFMNWMLAKGLGLQIPLGVLMLILPIIGVVQNAPSINGLGVREGAYVFFLGEYISDAGALALSICFYIVFLAASVCGGIIYVMGGGTKRFEVVGGRENHDQRRPS